MFVGIVADGAVINACLKCIQCSVKSARQLFVLSCGEVRGRRLYENSLRLLQVLFISS